MLFEQQRPLRQPFTGRSSSFPVFQSKGRTLGLQGSRKVLSRPERPSRLHSYALSRC